MYFVRRSWVLCHHICDFTCVIVIGHTFAFSSTKKNMRDTWTGNILCFFYFIPLELANDDAANSLLINSENESYRGNGLYCTFFCMIYQIQLDSQWHNWRNNPKQITIITGICPLFLWSWLWASRWCPMYRVFVESWRSVPKWYTYRHDVMLLELTMRHGIDVKAFAVDLLGKRQERFMKQLQCESSASANLRNHPFWMFKWYWQCLSISVRQLADFLPYLSVGVNPKWMSSIDWSIWPMPLSRCCRENSIAPRWFISGARSTGMVIWATWKQC